MFCSECGARGVGKFCTQCGSRLAASVAGTVVAETANAQPTFAAPMVATPASAQAMVAHAAFAPVEVVQPTVVYVHPIVEFADTAAAAVDWTNEIRVQALLNRPAIREMVSRHAAMAEKGVSAQEFLKAFDKVMQTGVPMAALAGLVQPLYGSMGMRTGKTRGELVPLPTGRVLVATLCSLARRGRRVRGVDQGENGCVLRANLPSDAWSFEGELKVAVRRHHNGTFVEATTEIKGQLMDWGKSRRCLDELFADMQTDPV